MKTTRPRLALPVAFVLAGTNRANGQEAGFLYDASGNLIARTNQSVPPISIFSQPQFQVGETGAKARFSVPVWDATSRICQWLFNGVVLSGTTNALAVREDYILALNDDGTVVGWGSNFYV